MSLLEELLAGPGPQERYMQLSQAGLFNQGGTRDPRASADSGFTPGAGGSVQDAWEIARWLERKGFQVSGLEGFQGTPESITTGHIDNSQHYSGMAGDVTYGGEGRWNTQDAALDWAEQRLQQRFGDALTELIWREPDHYDHLHYGTRPGG